MVVLDNLVVTTALPSIRANLGASIQDLEWTVNAYTLTFAVLLLTGAALGDRFGRKRVFLVGVAIFSAGSAVAAFSDTSTQLLISRAVQGLGGAIVSLVALTVSLPVAIATLAFYVAYRLAEDYLIVPRIIGQAVKVPALVTVVAALLGGALQGIVGALVAIPAGTEVPDGDEPPSPAPRRSHRHPAWADVPESDWTDWRWQSQHAVRHPRQLIELLPFTDDERRAVVPKRDFRLMLSFLELAAASVGGANELGCNLVAALLVDHSYNLYLA